ncbi:hypothetical protein RRG08_031327 [Elysia crispata]|uniref:Uncharacterized protein n=1 Tax=Elysia crispata TaxID=231223 RepID=A0AAE0YIK8_9GAST|nr:hypothetical protein RRG08_031327 [Elysia crispata]
MLSEDVQIGQAVPSILQSYKLQTVDCGSVLPGDSVCKVLARERGLERARKGHPAFRPNQLQDTRLPTEFASFYLFNLERLM